MNTWLTKMMLAVCLSQGEPMRGRLWIEWRGPAFERWAGELRLDKGRILKARCRRVVQAKTVWRRARVRRGGCLTSFSSRPTLMATASTRPSPECR